MISLISTNDIRSYSIWRTVHNGFTVSINVNVLRLDSWTYL